MGCKLDQLPSGVSPFFGDSKGTTFPLSPAAPVRDFSSSEHRFGFGFAMTSECKTGRPFAFSQEESSWLPRIENMASNLGAVTHLLPAGWVPAIKTDSPVHGAEGAAR